MFTKIKPILLYKKTLKFWVSLILVISTSLLHIIITKPCSSYTGFMCDYYFGFPISFWLITDFFDISFLLIFAFGFGIDLSIFYLILSLIFQKLKRSK
ncbi:hypothetical protein A2961_02570 [Candidatus Woesebacteria bacterium RIFCSPLOWO2_01_FULL_39_21]|uniref:Uncharacterized protein n=1 Tax=Candidatus Woesebacteria bacterium RIFCSPLOWO2_01_FULL_39_21 TaxID=1802519 RepID=A0A1F8BJ43_9BACT|nr:MAG: hypothetical protein A2691_02795 [Candidatus Woesebacteria bacterium RIFCSPHIGHO2_01_FULL_39_23]OGM63990.1 MAG: hypothetical protein A2961_02570 [Candidatus Woesebacteria bacterium RIFCSPLOWO2_01_FULL_39_21]